jgi:hypothetical protein
MTTVVMHSVVSLDGFIADADDAAGPLFDWYGNGEVEINQYAMVSRASALLPVARPDLVDDGDAGEPLGGLVEVHGCHVEAGRAAVGVRRPCLSCMRRATRTSARRAGARVRLSVYVPSKRPEINRTHVQPLRHSAGLLIADQP